MKARLYILFIAVAFFVLAPLLVPGYVFALDMVFGPHFVANYTDGQVLATWPLFSVISLLSIVIPNWIIQKVILLAILILAGIGGARLLREKGENAQIIAGVTYMFNPMVYTRFLTGHWLFLLGYALLPFWITAMKKLFDAGVASRATNRAKKTSGHSSVRQGKYTRRDLVITILLTNLLILLSFHMVWFMIIIGFIMLLVYRKSLQLRQATHSKTLKRLLGLGLITIVVQSFWLVPLLLNKTMALLTAKEQLAYFAVRGSFLEMLTGYGFWGQYEGFGSQFIWLSNTPILFVSALLALAGISGALFAFKSKDKLASIITLSGIVSLLLMLVSTTGFGTWLFDTIPGLMMMRDSHKFSALWMMTIAVGLACAWDYFEHSQRYSLNAKQIGLGALMILLAMQSYVMFYGFNGQLKSVKYPESWYEVAGLVDTAASEQATSTYSIDSIQSSDSMTSAQSESKSEFATHSMLILPWHQYMTFSFNDNHLMLNPAFRFFEIPLIYAKTPQYNGENIMTPSADMQAYDSIAADFHIEKSELNDIQYVMLLKEVDYGKYNIDLPILLETDDLILYEK